MMKPDRLVMKALLHKRQTELQKIIKQMKQDKLEASPVYRNLEQELISLQEKLVERENRF
jgi:hypothetical protein